MAQAGDQDRDALIAQASEWLARLDAGRADSTAFEAWRGSDPRRAAAFAEVAAAWSRLDALRDEARREVRRHPVESLASASLAAALAAAAVASLATYALTRRQS